MHLINGPKALNRGVQKTCIADVAYILKEEEDAATEFPSLLKLLSKKISLSGNSFLTRKWWYELMTSRPPPLPKNSETMRENILDRVEEGWQEEDWETTMPKPIRRLVQESLTSTRNMPSDAVYERCWFLTRHW